MRSRSIGELDELAGAGRRPYILRKMCMIVDSPGELFAGIGFDHDDRCLDMSVEFRELFGGYPELLMPLRTGYLDWIATSKFVIYFEPCHKACEPGCFVFRVPIPRNLP